MCVCVCVCVCLGLLRGLVVINGTCFRCRKLGGGAGRNARTDLHLSLQLPSTTLTASRNDPWCRLVWKPSGLVLKQESSSGPEGKLCPPTSGPLLCCCPQVLSPPPAVPPTGFPLSDKYHHLTFRSLWCYRLMRAGQGAGFAASPSQPPSSLPPGAGSGPRNLCGIPNTTLQPVSAPCHQPHPGPLARQLSD